MILVSLLLPLALQILGSEVLGSLLQVSHIDSFGILIRNDALVSDDVLGTLDLHAGADNDVDGTRLSLAVDHGEANIVAGKLAEGGDYSNGNLAGGGGEVGGDDVVVTCDIEWDVNFDSQVGESGIFFHEVIHCCGRDLGCLSCLGRLDCCLVCLHAKAT